MAVTFSGYELQPGHADGVGSDGLKKRTLVYKGVYSSLKALGASYNPSSHTEAGSGWVLEDWNLVKTKGAGIGELTVSLSEKQGSAATSDGGTAPVPLKDIWSVRAVRNDKSVFAYCGPSGANPQRAQIEMWMKEADGDLAAAYQYRDRDGEVISLESLGPATVELAQKIARGIESVIRFYPVVTRRRTYSSPPACMEKIGYIDTPPVGQAGISLSGHTWLKIQDDCDQQPDRTWTRTEGWWGVLSSEGGWDQDLYGTSRWGMPASIT